MLTRLLCELVSGRIGKSCSRHRIVGRYTRRTNAHSRTGSNCIHRRIAECCTRKSCRPHCRTGRSCIHRRSVAWRTRRIELKPQPSTLRVLSVLRVVVFSCCESFLVTYIRHMYVYLKALLYSTQILILSAPGCRNSSFCNSSKSPCTAADTSATYAGKSSSLMRVVSEKASKPRSTKGTAAAKERAKAAALERWSRRVDH